MKINSTLILLIILIIYSFSVGSDPILGDSLAFTVIASQGFDLATNATNHFLYMNLLMVLHLVFPFINPHYLFVAFSILCSLLTLHFLKKFLLLFDLRNDTTDIVIFFFAFTFTFWRISVITEVYSFYILCVTLFLYNAFLFVKNKKKTNLHSASILFGLMFLIHIQTILLVPFYLYFLFSNLEGSKIDTAKSLLIPAAIFSVLLIPVVQGKQSFMAIFTDDAWGSSFFHLELKIFIKSVARNFVFLLYNFLFFIFFIIKGSKNLPYLKLIVIGILPYIFFILKHDVSDSYVFHLVPYLFLLVLLGNGLEKFPVPTNYLLVFSVPLLYFTTFKIINHTTIGNVVNNETGFKGGVRYLFFPPLRGNPDLILFVEAYDKNKIPGKAKLDMAYQYAKDWMLIKKNF